MLEWLIPGSLGTLRVPIYETSAMISFSHICDTMSKAYGKSCYTSGKSWQDGTHLVLDHRSQAIMNWHNYMVLCISLPLLQSFVSHTLKYFEGALIFFLFCNITTEIGKSPISAKSLNYLSVHIKSVTFVLKKRGEYVEVLLKANILYW